MIKIFNATDTDFKTAGNIIINPLHCHEIKKKSLNGWYIEVEIPIKYKEYIEADKLCVVKTKSKLKPQAFRINDSITYTNRKIKFTAEHVMFDSRRYVLLDVRPTNLNGQNGLKYVNERTDKTSPFSITSNVENVSTAYFIRKTLLESWQVFEERWGGVFEADNWDISFKQSIGKDNGETIVYGKNMQGFEIFEDWSNVCTKILPVGYDGLLLPEKYLESETQYEIPYTKIVDFQTDLKTEEQTETNLLVELRNNASKYLEENCVPKVSYTVNSNVNNDLEIGDTIKVLHPFVNIFTEVLEYEYDLISEKVKSLTFGNYTRDVKTKFNNIKNTIETIKQTVSKQEITIKEQTNLINSLNKNGYVYIDDNEILILDQLPKEKAKNVWRFGLGGIGFSSKGYEGPFETAITMDGKINADFITTGTMAVDRIESLANFITDTSASIAAIELQQDSITTKVSSVEQSVENITNTQNTATGKNIHLEDSSDDPLVSIKVKGSTTQVTRSGKNLLNVTAKTTTTQGLTFTVNEDKSITINGTNTGTGTYYFRIANNFALPAGDYTLSNKNPSVNNNSGFIFYDDGNNFPRTNISNATFTKDTTIKPYLKVNAGVTVNNQTVYPMIIKGTYTEETFPEYEQYGASPSSDYPSPIKNIEGKNKFDINQEKEIFGIMLYKYSYYLKPNTKYTISSNCPASTTANIYANSNSSKSAVYINKNQTIQSDENGYFYILVRFKADASDNSTFNLYEKVLNGTYYIQLEEGTVATPYVSYNSLEIKDIGENLFDCANSKIIYNNAITLYERLTNGLKIISSGGRYNMIYFLVDTVDNLKGKTLTLSSDILFSKEKQYVDFGLYYTDFNGGNRKSFGIIESIKTEGYYTIKGIVEEGENRNYVCIGLRPNMDSNFAKGDYTIYDNLQVEIGETATPYKPYQEQKIDFPLSEGQKLYEGSYLASDGIHHKRKQTTVTIQNIVALSNGNVGGIFQFAGKKYSNNNVLCCDKAKHDQNRRFVTDTVYENQGNVVFVGDLTDTLETLKAKYDGAILEYELATEEIVPYTEAQQEDWDKIEQLHTYKNVTNIFSDTELDIVYVRDNGLSDMYETKQNASKNYTKTSTEIQQLDDSIKRTISQIGDRSQKITTVTEDIDGIKNEVSNIQDLTQTTSGTKIIVLSNCAKGNLLKLQIKGNNTVFKYLYPSDDLYPSDNLLPIGDSRILVNDIQYELGVLDTLRQNGEIYDEFVLENGQAKVIRRINTDGTVKTEEMTEDLGKLSISLNEGTNTIKILNYTAEITAKYAIKNNYTDIFATKVEMSSSIEQTAEGINQVVYKKVDEDEIISKINQSAEEVGIDANRININGAVSANGNFKIDTERKHEM